MRAAKWKEQGYMLFGFYLDVKTLARKQIPLLGDEGRREGGS